MTDLRSRFVAVVTDPRLRLALLIVFVVGASVAVLVLGGPDADALRSWIEDRGAWAPVVFVAAYIVLTVLFVPGLILTAASGLLFGTLAGTALTVVGATIGATAAFLIGRALGRDGVEAIAGERVAKLDRWLYRRAFVSVLYLRLVPLVPFNVLNYAAGVTAIPLRLYVAATAIGIVPGSFAYAALGGNLDDPTSPAFLGAAALVVVLAVAGAVVSRRRNRRSPDAPADILAGPDAEPLSAEQP